MLARRYQPHHPVLAIGEQVVRRRLSALGQPGSQLLREGRAYILAPTDNLADGAGQVFIGTSLIDVPGAAGLEYLAGVHFLGQDAQHQDRAPGILSLDFSHQVGAAAAGHGVVEHRDIPLEPPGHVECLVSTLRLTNHDHVVLRSDDLPEPPANDGVIVCDQDSHHGSPYHNAPLALWPRRPPVSPAWPARRSDLRQRNCHYGPLAADPCYFDP